MEEDYSGTIVAIKQVCYFPTINVVPESLSLILRKVSIVVVLRSGAEPEIRRCVARIMMRHSIKNILFSVCATSVPALYKVIE
jgi:hypothetical protein